jgi:hypothetical protein
MADYSAPALRGSGSLNDYSFVSGTPYTFTFYRPPHSTSETRLSGSGGFTYESVRNADGNYEGRPTYALGTHSNLDKLHSVVSSSRSHYGEYIFSYILYGETASFDWVPENNVPAGQVYFRCVGDYQMKVEPDSLPVSPTPTPSLTPTISLSITPSSTPSISLTPTPSYSSPVSATPTVSPSISSTPSVSITPSVTVTPSVTPSISLAACGDAQGYNGGSQYPSTIVTSLGSDTGIVDFTPQPATIPDRFIVTWNSGEVIDTGYISNNPTNYQFGGTLRGNFTASLEGQTAPEGGTYPLTPGGSSPNVIESDGYPEVVTTGTYSFTKTNSTSLTTTEVYAPMGSTIWSFTLSCPTPIPTVTPSISVSPSITPSISVTPSVTITPTPSNSQPGTQRRAYITDAQTKPTDACNSLTTATIYYLNNEWSNLTNGDIIYTDPGLSNPLVGGNSYYGWNYSSNVSPNQSFIVNNSGEVSTIANC